MAVVPWHEELPERAKWELDRFADYGLVPQSRVTEAGLLEITCDVEFQGTTIPVQVLFPLDYPDKAPEVNGPPGLLRRHQGLGGNFCVLEDSANDWSPERCAAELVAVNLGNLLDDWMVGEEQVAAGEADYPEPATGFFLYDENVVLVPDPFLDDTLPATGGDMELHEVSSRAMMLVSCQGLAAPDGKVLSRMLRRSPARKQGAWVSIDPAPIPSLDLNPLLNQIEEVSPEALARIIRKLKKKRVERATQWLGITFPEEGPTRGEFRRSWLFLEVEQTKKGTRSVTKVVRAQGLNLRERERRIPELVGASTLRVLIVGAGSVGAPIAFELAKAGVGRLDLVDNDSYDVNNSVRHVLRPLLAGINKAQAVALECQALNPFIEAEGHPVSVGGNQDASARLDELIREADIVVDATASQTATRILQKRCREQNRILVVAGLTRGSHGGEVVLVRGEGACHQCFVYAQQDGLIPTPHSGPASKVVPVGCSHPAFSGAGFDATELAALATRTIIQASGTVGYPPPDYDWVVVNFRADPRVQHGSLEVHNACNRAH
jgi:molybdopterin/thiamine biosynthesis adenylyltransferase